MAKSKFYRYMSMSEFDKLMLGLTIHGKSKFNARTNSTGICFLGEHTEIVSTNEDGETTTVDFSPLDCYRFLGGIVSNNILVEFEADTTILSATTGVYADPLNMDEYARVSITEYCIPEYNNSVMRPLAYCLPNVYGEFDSVIIPFHGGDCYREWNHWYYI